MNRRNIDGMLDGLFNEPREQISDVIRAILHLIDEQSRSHEKLRDEFRDEIKSLRRVNDERLHLIQQLKNEIQVRIKF